MSSFAPRPGLRGLAFIPRLCAQRVIWAYQKTLSPDHGPLKVFFPYGCCRFFPTCSQYGREALGRFGLIRGSFFALWRLLRCHPWAEGGEDKVPNKKDAG